MDSTNRNMDRFFNNSTSRQGRFNGTVPFFHNPNRFRNQSMDTSTAPVLLGIGGALMFVTLTLLTARLWSRLRPIARLHADDWTVVGAVVLAIVDYILISASVVHGLGRRARFVSFSRRRTALELLFISQIFWYWSITLVKLSVACLLLRVKAPQRRWRIFLYTIMVLLVLAAVVQTIFTFVQCRPFSVFWDPRVARNGQVKCFPRAVINGNIVAFSSVQVAVDLVFSFIPITFIRKLNLPRREKIFMCVLMALGLFASCAAIIRTMTLQEYYRSQDLFRTNVTISIWAVVEQQFAIVAATIPTLKAFLEKALVKIGLFFYDEGSETVVRKRLVAFGLLGEDDDVNEEGGRNGSLVEGLVAKKSGAVKDAYAESVASEKDEKDEKEIEVILAKLPV